MKLAAVRLNLLDKIGRELQRLYSYEDIDTYLSEYKISPPPKSSYNSKWLYAKAALRNEKLETIIEIAKELDIDVTNHEIRGISSPECWNDKNHFRLFLSHLAIHKEKALRLKEVLKPFYINAFVAHEDVVPTKEWQNEIEKALFTMDAMLAIHTSGFSKSVWTQQEVGFSLGRGIKILSLRLGEDPQGFISKHQAILRRARKAEEIAEEINSILITDDLTKNRMNDVRSAYQRENEAIPF